MRNSAIRKKGEKFALEESYVDALLRLTDIVSLMMKTEDALEYKTYYVSFLKSELKKHVKKNLR